MTQFLNAKLFRGSKVAAFDAIRNEVVDVVINLETETKELIFGGANDELLLCMAHGVRLYDFQLSGYVPPDRNVVEAVLHVIDIYPDRRVFFHCRQGHERTGFIAALYRVRVEGWSLDNAVAEWEQMGCHKLWIWAWKKRLASYCNRGPK